MVLFHSLVFLFCALLVIIFFFLFPSLLRTLKNKTKPLTSPSSFVVLIMTHTGMDGKELTTIGLQLLRRHLITLIPQNPVVFSGTIRFNLDPYDEHSEESLLSMLNDLLLIEVVEQREGGINGDCGKNGDKLSHGQRQLLVVGRALLQKNRTRLYLLDEATSSMDDGTDDIVQAAIRKHADGITTITVAHRLLTVLHCDRIAVVEQGAIVQIGEPSVICYEEGSPFQLMMETSGIPTKDWPKKKV